MNEPVYIIFSNLFHKYEKGKSLEEARSEAKFMSDLFGFKTRLAVFNPETKIVEEELI